MAIKILKWLSITLVVGIAALALLLDIGARMSLDRDFQHSRDTEALPLFSAGSSAELVRISANGYEFRARIAGFETAADAAEKPAVILLHGFPVTSAMWNKLIPPLIDAGYRVVAFDQRGYSPGARPDGPQHYTVEQLSGDVIAVADSLGLEQFHLIGHDWGAAVGWATVLAEPERILSWTGLSIPHPAAFAEALQNDPDQRARSSYFLLFSTPWLAESLFSFNDFKMLELAYSGVSRAQRHEYLKVFAEPGALTAAFNWYRAAINLNPGKLEDSARQVFTPTLFIWGSNDGAVSRFAIEAQAQYMTGPYEEVELVAGHWLLVDRGERVIEAVLRHLAYYNSGL